MKALVFLVTLFVSSFAFAGINVIGDTLNLGIFDTIKCSSGIKCEKLPGFMQISAKTAQAPVLASATTIVGSQCGSTFYNAGAVLMNLPEAGANLGCKLTFVTLNASNFDVNPDNADIILVLTNAAGDSIRNATLGNTVTLQAVSASQWAVVGINGTYTDIN